MQNLSNVKWIVLFGVPGVGIRSLIEHFTQKHHHHLLKVKLTFQEERLKLFTGESELQADDFFQRLDTDQMQVVSLQLAEHSFMGNVQIHALCDFLQQLHCTPTIHLYLFHFHEFVWKSFSLIPQIKKMFTEIKAIAPMDQSTLKQLIYQRHHVVGYSLHFISPKKRNLLFVGTKSLLIFVNVGQKIFFSKN